MFYLTSKFHENRVNTFGFIEGAFEAPLPSPPCPGTPKKPRPNKVNEKYIEVTTSLFIAYTGKMKLSFDTKNFVWTEDFERRRGLMQARHELIIGVLESGS